MHCSADGDGSCTRSVDCPSFGLDDFTQSSWYTSLYSSPNAAIIETNDPPLDEQLPSLRANQLEAITELEKVNQKIQSLQSLLSDAISYHTRLRKVVSDYRAALSPIRRIPFEIIHRILENTDLTLNSCHARPVTPTLDLELYIYNGPWRFSKVCQLWRAVAIQSPEFWCDISIDFTMNKNREYRSSGLCALLYEGIRRSASRGLQVWLHQDCMSDDDDDSEQDEDEDSGRGKEDVIRTLFAHSSQIRALAIKMFYSFELDDIISSSSCNFAFLQRLSIELADCDPSEGSSILQAFDGSPSLVEVKLNGLPVGKPYRNLNFPWDQLQIFEQERSLVPADVVDLMHLCPRLQKYSGEFSGVHILDSPVTPTAIHHTTITHLELFGGSHHSLLQHTTIPSLTILRVSEFDDVQMTYLIRFITRSQCAIQELDFFLTGTYLLKCNDLLELLQSLLRLTLRLENISQLNEFHSALTPERLPRLEALEIEVYAVTRNPRAFCTPELISTLVHIIQSRSNMLRSFTFCPDLVEITSWPSSESYIVLLRALLAPYNQKLRVWIEGGMELHLFHALRFRPA
jgi:hypothetical protein